MMESDKGEEFQLFELKKANGKRHSALRVPRVLPSDSDSPTQPSSRNIFNILMADISGSMWSYWPHIVIGWQESIQNKLMGHTKIFAFGDHITLKREGTDLTQEDFTGDGTNDLTGALKTVREEVDKCQESFVRVFIIADGAHDHGDPYPESEICKMRPPPGKTVSVFVFGLGPGFPVENSIDIRSNLHNGNANIPSLFWAKSDEDIVGQLAAIGNELESSLVKLTLNYEGYLAPGLDKTSVLHPGEWLYFEEAPEELPPLSVSLNDGEPLVINAQSKPVNMGHLLQDLFRQWNSVLIQQHRKKCHVPHETFDLMESMFTYNMGELKVSLPKSNDIKSRLCRKHLKAYDIEYRTLMNQSKKVISIEGQYKNELELAETILRSTVTNRKFDTRNLKLKGHDQDEFESDMKEFKKLYEKTKAQIMALEPPSPDDCCRVTITSTLQDLQDPDISLMFNENKFEFLRNFTMTGIPVYAPVRDASQINPWTLVIKHILVTPFTILSQLVLEESASINHENLGKDKDVLLQQDNEKTRFNAVIPIVPASAAEVLKPLVKSNIYAMMATFCILKNPHIIDYNAHLAALACAWIRTVREYPKRNRQEFAVERLQNIEATANIYMDRPSVQQYINALINNPKQAMMTKSTDEFDGKSLQCESLIKPAFFMYLKRDKFSMQQVTAIIRLMLYEFLGRCLSKSMDHQGTEDTEESNSFTAFFCMELTDPEKKKAWFAKHCTTVMDAFQTSHGSLLESFFTLDDLILKLKIYTKSQVAALTEKLMDDLSLVLNIKKVKKLRNFGSCGDIKFTSFQTWVQEIDIPDETIEEIFSPSQLSIYVCEALQSKSSRDRHSKDLPSAKDAHNVISKKISEENVRSLRRTILKEVTDFAVKLWREAYYEAHRPLVMPMSKEEIIKAAQARGIQVTQETFKQIYRYDRKVGLVRNACQIPGCPHYLQPRNNFNQHLSIEREQEYFPHALHLVSHEFFNQGINSVLEEVTSGKHSGKQNRKKPAPPQTSTLEPLVEQLQTLLNHYATVNESSVHESNSQNEEEEDTFFDCEG